jgi:hypothetical protein
MSTTTDDIDDTEDEDLDDDADEDDAVDDVDEAGHEPAALYDRGIESADDTGLIAGEELITNAQILEGLSGKP